ncbi:unnamed protein product [Psylliodes chrysocephalus]|uniref:Uncharacterized protein n=1 Tax=Psylliodes chrysocephalus TaxID=3402493 RepID=A0A9P0DDK9_9CUCU|nr:unnamed protein product [Psylliodes chrysocephala]
MKDKENPNQDQNKIINKNVSTIRKYVPIDVMNSGHKIEVSHREARIWDKRDRCPYCNLDVTNFSRHLFRKHPQEESVAKIEEISKGNPRRKQMIELLRKQGNFSLYSENIIRPVQRLSSTNFKDDLTFLPCTYCKGLYRKTSLSRHAKICVFNNKNKSTVRRYPSEAQTLLAFTESRKPFLDQLRLKNEVFQTMHADRISLISKGDPIICQYGDDYLKKHKRPHIKNLVSNKMREMGRLLIHLKDVYNIQSILETLKPQHFDKVVSAARITAGYCELTKQFRAPSLASHYHTNLLAICSTATTLLLKQNPILPVKNYSETLKDVDNFRTLVKSNWKFEMGSLAIKDLTEKHALTPQILPVTEDVVLFNNHCYKIADESANHLQNNLENIDAFKTLSETILALTISLNRKRVGDVQYIKLESYQSTTQKTVDCLGVLTECEKALTSHFKRIITIGKGSKPVPILFPKKIQGYIEVMLKCRNSTTFIPKENPFLFALVGSISRWIDASRVLKKYAISSGAKNPETITSSRLRKQIATFLQILSLSEAEMEQMATFMGHTKKTHEEFYRLPQELYQTSKIAKLLLTMMNKGISKQDQGKTINELDIALNTWETNEAEVTQSGAVMSPETEGNDPVSSNTKNDETEVSLNMDLHLPEKTKYVGKEKRTRGTWTSKQKQILLKYFKNQINNKVTPRKSDCLKFKEKNLEVFEEKTWLQIKVFVYNSFKNTK